MVVVLADQLLDVGPHAFGLTLQHDDDGGMLTHLQQVQEAPPENACRSVYSNTDIVWRDGKETTPSPEVTGAPLLLQISVREQEDKAPGATHVHQQLRGRFWLKEMREQ